MNWKGTKGQFKQNGLHIVEVGKHSIGQALVMNFKLNHQGQSLYDAEGLENARLWTDAQNTIQLCDKMPSELLKENELLDVLSRSTIQSLDVYTHNLNQSIKLLKNLIEAALKKTPVVHIPDDEYLYTAIHEAKDLINTIEYGK